jgi:acylphosphatase
MKTYKLNIQGTVQGVFFRRFLSDTATKLELKGYARNMDDGSIEVIVEGEIDKIREFLKICKNGPPHSQVGDVETQEIKHQGFSEFKILKI